jgi:hypothetical protein
MHMEKTVWIGLLIVITLLAGCESAFERRLKSDTCDRYAISAQSSTFRTADSNFLGKADYLCPHGYKVLKKYYENGELRARIECTCQAGSGADAGPAVKEGGREEGGGREDD